MRDDEEETMENWNDEKLQEVVLKKHSAEKRMPTTDIVSTNCVSINQFRLHS